MPQPPHEVRRTESGATEAVVRVEAEDLGDARQSRLEGAVVHLGQSGRLPHRRRPHHGVDGRDAPRVPGDLVEPGGVGLGESSGASASSPMSPPYSSASTVEWVASQRRSATRAVRNEWCSCSTGAARRRRTGWRPRWRSRPGGPARGSARGSWGPRPPGPRGGATTQRTGVRPPRGRAGRGRARGCSRPGSARPCPRPRRPAPRGRDGCRRDHARGRVGSGGPGQGARG